MASNIFDYTWSFEIEKREQYFLVKISAIFCYFFIYIYFLTVYSTLLHMAEQQFKENSAEQIS